MHVAINKDCTLDIWSLFSEYRDDDEPSEPSEFPWSVDAIADSIQHVLEAERPAGYKWVKVHYPEGGNTMLLQWYPQKCPKCAEAEEHPYGWCPKHTWYIEEGNGIKAREQALKFGVPPWIVKAMDSLNTGTLNIGNAKS